MTNKSLEPIWLSYRCSYTNPLIRWLHGCYNWYSGLLANLQTGGMRHVLIHFHDFFNWVVVGIYKYILKQKSLATHYRYAYLLQKSMLKLTQKFFTVNAITILFNTKYFKHRCKIWFVWCAVPVIECFQKDKMSIFDRPPRASEMVPDGFGGYSCTRDSS